jgi:predicted PurR-regulated permease PerM
VYLLLTGHWVQAIILTAWGGVVISSVDNFLRPKLVGGRVGLNELVMFFAVLGGLQLFGILGLVIGPVVFAVAGSILAALSENAATSRAATATERESNPSHSEAVRG